MKLFKQIIFGLLVIGFAVACNDGIDPISRVEPGPDESAPKVKLSYPVEGTKIKVNDPVVAIDIEFEVTDDIEVDNIVVFMDGTEIATLTDFKDYRRVLATVPYDNVTTGVHELKVTATDTDGKSTTEIANFEKQPPYVPLFDNEVLYMAFDGDYTELISVTKATKVGNPGFAGEGVASPNAYAGATDSYLTFPIDGLQLTNEVTGIFWYKVNPNPDRAGILVISPPMDGADNVLTSGFRFFRENAGGKQRFKLNVGIGDDNVWVDGGEAADIDPNNAEWVNLAFTISDTKAIVYINGQLVKASDITGIDWTDCNLLSIMSGAPNFTGWNHFSDLSFMDELRLFNKAMTQAEIQNVIGATNPYEPADGETAYFTFDDNYTNKVDGSVATEVGTPGFAGEAKKGSNAYQGAPDSYLNYPLAGVFGSEFSVTFWYKVNGDPGNAGIVVVGNDVPENRNQGFRIFREGSVTEQRIKSNIGIGAGEVWNDGSLIDVTAEEWVHIAITASQSKSKIYFNGVEVNSADMDFGVDWTDCNTITIGSGGETFAYWNHKYDSSYLDELHFFNKALSQAEVAAVMGN